MWNVNYFKRVFFLILETPSILDVLSAMFYDNQEENIRWLGRRKKHLKESFETLVSEWCCIFIYIGTTLYADIVLICILK